MEQENKLNIHKKEHRDRCMHEMWITPLDFKENVPEIHKWNWDEKKDCLF